MILNLSYENSNPVYLPAIHHIDGQAGRIIRLGRKRTPNYSAGSALVVVVVSLLILLVLGAGLLIVAWGTRHKAIRFQNEAAAMLAAEAGYEKAVFWMSQQQDVLTAIYKSATGTSGALSFPDADCEYQIQLFSFAKYRPIYRVLSIGHSGVFDRTVDVKVVQAVSGWDMGKCRVPDSTSSTRPVYFAGSEIIDMPIHINNLKDSPDYKDIYITGSPRFLQPVGMGEGRYAGSTDKYDSVIGLFEDGIYFNQPDSKITNEATIQSKVDRFKNSTKEQFRLTPVAAASITNPKAAVQLEFFVEGDVGKVRITNNCTVRGFWPSSTPYDYKIQPETNGQQFERYHLYAYHVRSANADSTGERFVVPVEQTYVTQSIGGVESDPGGQIFVDGNVIIGSGDSLLLGQDRVKGKITVVATGNIWIADSIVDDGLHNADDGKPSANNPNVLGLVAQGVVKVVDPGMSDYSYVDGSPVEPSGYEYVPIGRPDIPSAVKGDTNYNKRNLPDPTVVEAAITVGGGGWGAENVAGQGQGRKEYSPPQDDLIVRGTITEAFRGVVGVVGSDGYLKHYYFDQRVLTGILPGDIWLRGKYIPAPAGWHDYRASN